MSLRLLSRRLCVVPPLGMAMAVRTTVVNHRLERHRVWEEGAVPVVPLVGLPAAVRSRVVSSARMPVSVCSPSRKAAAAAAAAV